MHDHGGQAVVADHLFDDPFGRHFAALIGANREDSVCRIVSSAGVPQSGNAIVATLLV